MTRAITELPQPSRPTRLTGGPGSGKTTALAALVAARLRAGADPTRVVVVTPSHSAGSAFEARLDLLLPGLYRPPRILTHERLAGWILDTDPHGDRRELRRVGEWVAMDAALERSRSALRRLLPLAHEPGCVDDLLALCGAFKQALVGPALLAQRLADERGVLAEITVVAARYQTVLEEMGARDTKDLAGDALTLLQADPRARHHWADLLVVDQAEDLSPAQWYLIRELIGRLTEPHAAVVAGDPTVALTEFAGPSPRCFEELFPRELRPEEWHLGNRPSSLPEMVADRWGLASPDLGASLRVASVVPAPEVRLWRAPDEADEAFAVAREIRRARLEGEIEYDQVAVLVARAGAQMAAVRQALAGVGVPFRIERTRWSESLVAGQVTSWLAALCAPHDEALVLRILTDGPSAPSLRAVDRLRRSAARERRSVAAALRTWDGDLEDPAGELASRARLWRDLGGGDPGLAARRLDTSGLLALLGSLELRLGLARLALQDCEAAAALARLNLAAQDAGGAREALRLADATLTEWLQLLTRAVRRSGWDAERRPAPDRPEVSVLSLSQAKGRHWRRVFLVGVAEGLLPGPAARTGLLSPEDSQRLVELVPEMEEVLGPGDDRLDRERHRLLLGISRADQQLTVSWALRYGERPVEGTPFGRALEELVGGAVEAPLALDVTESDCLSTLAGALAGNGTPPSTGWAPPGALELAAQLSPWDPVAASIAGPPSRLSASSLRRWLACPRLYHFHRLRVTEPESREMVQGTAAHTLLERMYRDGDTKALGGEEFAAAAGTLIRAEILPWVRERLLDPLEVLAVEIWLRALLFRWVQRIVDPGPALVGSPLAHEVGFAVPRRGYELVGRIDAVWRGPSGELEVVDYKTGAGPPTSRDRLMAHLLGDDAGPPQDWQLAIYQLAARSGALAQLLGEARPVAVRNWYLGQDPSSRFKVGLAARGFLVGPEGTKVAWSDALLTPEAEAEFEALLDREAAELAQGAFPALPRHDEGTCLSDQGCPWGACCDGAGSAGWDWREVR